MLSKLMEEFEQKITLQTEQSKTVSDSTAISDSVKAPVEIVPQLSVSNSNNNLAEIAVHNENEVAASKEEAAETSKEVAASEEEAAEIEEVAASEEEAAETSKGVEASEEEAAETSKGVEASEDEAEETSKGVEASEDEAEETSKGVEASKEEAAETSKGVAASKEEAAERSKRVAASKERVVRTSKGVAASKEGAVRTSKGVAPSKVETSKRVAASKKEAVATSKVEAVKTSERVAASKEVASKEVTSKEVAVQPPPPTVVVVCNCKKPDPVKLKIQFERRQMMTEKHLRDIQELRNVLAAVKGDVGVIKTKYKEEVSNLGNHLQTVTHAAKQYKKVLEENRKLYNVIQDLKGNIRVYCRVRPFLPGQENSVTVVGGLDDGSITITSNSKGGKDSRKTFTFNKVYGPNATQVEIFSDTQPLIRSVLDGYNVCIFAYGQTGAGKTHTMSGPKHITEETAGVNYRALGDLFLISDERKDMIAYDINVQMIEIYNEQVRDLLATDGVVRRLEIRNNSQTGINVPDANLVPVKTTSDVITLMDLGHKNRAVSSTSMNDRSSRSHSCLTVHVQGKDLSSGQRVRGCMHLVDLAGSERIEKSEVVGDALKEAQHINKSLAALGDVIASLSHKSGHVPYRNSKLTQLLQDSLGGQAKTLMFVCMSPEPHALMETLSTLKFAERVSSVELGAAKSNKDSSETKELKQQISSLKAALARQDGDAFGEDDAWDEDNDDNDAATSDSDADHLNQSISRPSSLPNLGAAGQKAKKPPSKLSTAPDKRSAVPAPAKKKVPTGATPVSKTTKSPAPARKPINAK